MIQPGPLDKQREIERLDDLVADLRAEIVRLQGMVRDLYLWLNAALATQFDRDFDAQTLNDIANGIDSNRWREIKSVVGQAADEEGA